MKLFLAATFIFMYSATFAQTDSAVNVDLDVTPGQTIYKPSIKKINITTQIPDKNINGSPKSMAPLTSSLNESNRTIGLSRSVSKQQCRDVQELSPKEPAAKREIPQQTISFPALIGG